MAIIINWWLSLTITQQLANGPNNELNECGHNSQKNIHWNLAN
jgi:hypothetical protein